MMNINSKQILTKYLQNLLRRFSFSAKIQFFIIEIESAAWFQMRVIPKPSWAGYPCVRAAALVASVFVLCVGLLTLSIIIFKRFGEYLKTCKIQLPTLFMIHGLGVSLMSPIHNSYAGRFLPWVYIIIANAKRTLFGNHHTSSNIHIQIYLDEFCYKVNRGYYNEKLFKRLLIASVSIN